MRSGKVTILKWTIRQSMIGEVGESTSWQNVGDMPARSAAEAVKFQYPDMVVVGKSDQPGRFLVQNPKDTKWTLDVIVQQVKA